MSNRIAILQDMIALQTAAIQVATQKIKALKAKQPKYKPGDVVWGHDICCDGCNTWEVIELKIIRIEISDKTLYVCEGGEYDEVYHGSDNLYPTQEAAQAAIDERNGGR